MSTGPQTYPGASKTYWYQDTYPGDAQEVNVVVLHTTEGRTLPDYDGGAVAPTLTAVPDFAARKLRWYQHFSIDTSARALVNLPGGVETNTNNVCQLELVGTCDPATRNAWVKAGKREGIDFIYWPEAPDWALRGVAEFLAWMHTKHGVPLSGPKTWKAYPSSYGASNGVRMNDAQWNAFKGVCGHMHVDENLHGDPGSIDFARLIEFAMDIVSPPSTATTPTTPSEEDAVPQDLNEANANDVDLPSGQWTGLAMADAVIHIGPRVHDTLVHLFFDPATPADATIEGRFYLTDTAGKNPSAYLITTKHGGGGHQFVHSVKVPAGKHLRFEVRPTTADGSTVKLLHRVASGPYWEVSS